MLDEVEQARVRPLEVLEDEHDGPVPGETLEEEPPGREEVLALVRRLLSHSEQLREPRLDPRALLGIGQPLVEHRRELRLGFLRRVLLGDERAHPHHFGQRPVRDAVPVGEAATAMPPGGVGEAVDVLLELPGEPGLADPADPDHRDELRLSLLAGRVE